MVIIFQISYGFPFSLSFGARTQRRGGVQIYLAALRCTAWPPCDEPPCWWGESRLDNTGDLDVVLTGTFFCDKQTVTGSHTLTLCWHMCAPDSAEINRQYTQTHHTISWNHTLGDDQQAYLDIDSEEPHVFHGTLRSFSTNLTSRLPPTVITSSYGTHPSPCSVFLIHI